MDNIETVTLFVNNLEDSKLFYAKAFSIDVVYEDSVSWVFSIGGLMLNLLQKSEADELTTPLKPGDATFGPTFLFTARVDDVDSTCHELERNGVGLLNGPLDRPWGRRTAAFSDPDGYVWEIAQEVQPASP